MYVERIGKRWWEGNMEIDGGEGGRKYKEVGGLRWGEVRELQTRLTASFQILFGT